MANITISIVLSDEQQLQLAKLQATRKGKTSQQVLDDVIRKALDNEVYRQNRNREQAQLKKLVGQAMEAVKSEHSDIYDEIATRFGL